MTLAGVSIALLVLTTFPASFSAVAPPLPVAAAVLLANTAAWVLLGKTRELPPPFRFMEIAFLRSSMSSLHNDCWLISWPGKKSVLS